MQCSSVRVRKLLKRDTESIWWVTRVTIWTHHVRDSSELSSVSTDHTWSHDQAHCSPPLTLHSPGSWILQRKLSCVSTNEGPRLDQTDWWLVDSIQDELEIILHQVQVQLRERRKEGDWEEVVACVGKVWCSKWCHQLRSYNRCIQQMFIFQSKLSDSGSGSNMEVEWNTGMIRNLRMNYIILDTDYNSRTLVCSCHDINLGFLSVNRRSCEYLIVRTTYEDDILFQHFNF